MQGWHKKTKKMTKKEEVEGEKNVRNEMVAIEQDNLSERGVRGEELQRMRQIRRR